MKVLKIVFLIAGNILIIAGITNAFGFDVVDNSEMSNQTIGMIGLGILALLAAFFIKNKRPV